MKLKLVILFSLYSCFVFSQSGRINIEWEKGVEENVIWYGENSEFHIKRIGFKGASYETDYPSIPVFTKIVEIGNESAQIEISNKVFKVLSNEEASVISDNALISSEIIINQHVAISRKKNYLEYSFVPIRYNLVTGQYEKLLSFSLDVIPGTSLKSIKKTNTYPVNSVLSTGKWYKFKLTRDGVYKITYSDVVEMGFENPSDISIYGYVGGMLDFVNDGNEPTDLEEIKISKYYSGDNTFDKGDYILFYAKGPTSWEYDDVNKIYRHKLHLYSYYSYYFITDKKKGAEIGTLQQSTGSVTITVSSFDDHLYHEYDTVNLIHTGRTWYGESFESVTNRNFEFYFPNIVSGSEVKAEFELLGRSSSPSDYDVSANGTIISQPHMGAVLIPGSATSAYAVGVKDRTTFTTLSPTINIGITYKKNYSSDEGYLNYIVLNARRNLKMTGDQMHFRDISSVDSSNISRFILSDVNTNMEIWDITDVHNASKINITRNGSNAEFKLPTNYLREFIVFNTQTGLLKPTYTGDDVGPVENQNLHALNNINYIIIANNKFVDQANELADFHRKNSGLSVEVLTQEPIYNEFSSGARDVSAIRNFMKMLYDKAAPGDDTIKYLLLFGDGSYDNKHDIEGNSNLVITYQSEYSLKQTESYVTDDFFGLLDNGEEIKFGRLDIGIGRFPVNTVAEADTMVAKVKSYYNEESQGDWHNTICFVGDDEDGNLHMNQADQLSSQVLAEKPGFFIDKVFLDSYKQEKTSQGDRYPDVNKAIRDKMRKGALIMNYTGHGSEYGLSHERIIKISDINSMDNSNRLPIFFTATCEFSRYDYVEFINSNQYKDFKSAGELLVLNPIGGAIASFTTTRVVWATNNFELNQNFYSIVFQLDDQGNRLRLGDVMRLTKTKTGGSINKRNFSLLGDPALEMAFPVMNVVTDSINHDDVTLIADTVGALDKVTISGHVAGLSGDKLTDFSGTVYPAVYDKQVLMTTLQNDKNDPFQYYMQINALYKGKAEVENGDFTFSFIVPKDISYNIGKGRIVYYASNNEIQANGSDTSIIIGGFSDELVIDNEGPRIQLFLNDSNFIDGGITDDSPVLLAYVSDSTGINTVGSGIGHDITASMDYYSGDIYVLNDYYEAETNSYQRGVVKYPLSDLEEGEHTLVFKVWDVLNNSSEKEISFIVTLGNNLEIEKLFNYPNPLVNHTSFVFEHNKPDNDLEVMIQIYTLSGQLVKTINTYIPAGGFRTPEIQWDARGDNGGYIPSGIYIYKVRVDYGDGFAEKFEKMIVKKAY